MPNLFNCQKRFITNLFFLFEDIMADEYIDYMVLDGPVACQERLPLVELNFSWEKCPAPVLLGVPLMVKSIRRYSGASPKFQPAVFMMIDPETGFAPPEWQLGPHCNRGMLGFAREDRTSLTCEDWVVLYDYIYGLMDVYSKRKNCRRF